MTSPSASASASPSSNSGARRDDASRAPQRYAVVGNPVEHSRSPSIHSMFGQQSGQSIVYTRLLAPVDAFVATVDRFRADGGRGLNVTVPFKEEAFRYATVLTQRARMAGAVNTLSFEDERVLGDNTDGIGLVTDIGQRLGVDIEGTRVLLLGAGGAARGVLLPLLEAGAADVVIVNRTFARSERLAAEFDDPRVAARPAPRGDERFDIVINATSAQLHGATPPMDPAWIAGAHLAYDMMYAAAPTAFMVQARAAGCAQVSDGLGMLVEQAAESFLVWRGVRPATAPVYAALRAAIDGPASTR